MSNLKTKKLIKKINKKDINSNEKQNHLKKIFNIITNIGNIVLKEIINDNTSDDEMDNEEHLENNNFETERTPIKVSWKVKNRTVSVSVS